jgi:Fe-S-cluster-containing hydrogenase component 2
MKVLIDMIALRAAMISNPLLTLPEALCHSPAGTHGLKTIRELTVFRITCRRCEEAPCIAVCPAGALGKDNDGVVTRYTNLCVSCKSCVTICPFGTMMTDFFRHHGNRDLLYNLCDHEEARKFVEACPPGTAMFTDQPEIPEEHIYQLNDNVLIRDYMYVTETE